jgi:essential nuclear protein 1
MAPPATAVAERQHKPLAEEILNAGHLRTKSGKRKSRSDEDEKDHYVDAKTSRRILQIGQDLAEEDETERRAAAASKESHINSAFDFDSRFGADEGSEDEEHDKYNVDEWGDEEEIVEEVVWLRVRERSIASYSR